VITRFWLKPPKISIHKFRSFEAKVLEVNSPLYGKKSEKSVWFGKGGRGLKVRASSLKLSKDDSKLNPWRVKGFAMQNLRLY
jgi:hypothetical protein